MLMKVHQASGLGESRLAMREERTDACTCVRGRRSFLRTKVGYPAVSVKGVSQKKLGQCGMASAPRIR